MDTEPGRPTVSKSRFIRIVKGDCLLDLRYRMQAEILFFSLSLTSGFYVP